MTQEEFKLLPMVLTRFQTLRVLGCDKKTLRCLREQYPELALRLPGMLNWKYRKVIVAQIAGVKYD